MTVLSCNRITASGIWNKNMKQSSRHEDMIQNISITFSGTHSDEDVALLIEAIAGEVRRGSPTGSAREYSWRTLDG
jgi:hypothetical protein